MNITILLCKCSHDGHEIYSKEIINLDMVTLRSLMDTNSMLIFEHGNKDVGEIIVDAYAK